MMNIDSKKVIFQIKSHANFARMLMCIWIVFAVYKYNVNPNFFLFSIILAILIVMLVQDITIKLKKDYIEIKETRWFIFLNSVKTIYLNEIIEISFEERKLPELYYIFFSLLTPGGTMRNNNKLIIKFRNDSVPYEIRTGTIVENKTFVKLVNEKIK
jgi:hypothetical protein